MGMVMRLFQIRLQGRHGESWKWVLGGPDEVAALRDALGRWKQIFGDSPVMLVEMEEVSDVV